MKRYFLFYNECFYPNFGMEDFKGDFNTIEEVKKFAIDLVNKEDSYTLENSYITIWDSAKREDVFSECSSELRSDNENR